MATQKKTIVIKIGGKAVENAAGLSAFITEAGSLSKEADLILIHGGGADVTRVSKVFGIEAVFKNGVRITSAQEMDIVDMVLCGKFNKHLVRLLHTQGINAVGLSGCDGELFTGKSLDFGTADTTHTGIITSINTKLLKLLLEHGYMPVLSSASMEKKGKALNINADEAAFGIAGNLPADTLLFISDIPGVLKNDTVLKEVPAKEAQELIQSGIVSGGMIPKVQSSLLALEQGVRHIVIGQYLESGDLKRLLENQLGTRIYQ